MDELISNCRVCRSNNLKDVFDLGSQPPANSLRKSLVEKLNEYPLKLVFCDNCKLVQLNFSVNPKNLFDKYFWVTATSKTAKDYSSFFFNEMNRRSEINNKFVLEIASNDGTFLLPFKKNNSKVLGIDPAKNIASEANKNGIKTLCNYFDFNTSNKIKTEEGIPSLIFARNVIPHVKEINSVVQGISNLSEHNTTVAIEFHYSKIILEELHYDSIYHEHLFYFTIKTINYLFNKFGLYSFDLFESPISGGSVVLLFSKQNKKKSNKLIEYEKYEEKFNLNNYETWLNFSQKSYNHSLELKKVITKLSNNKKIVGYGASARSSTLLNFINISNKNIEFIIDQNPLKNNLYTPGSDILIKSTKEGFLDLKDKSIILLAWNFREEIISILKKFNFNGNIIIPLPNKVDVV